MERRTFGGYRRHNLAGDLRSADWNFFIVPREFCFARRNIMSRRAGTNPRIAAFWRRGGRVGNRRRDRQALFRASGDVSEPTNLSLLPS